MPERSDRTEPDDSISAAALNGFLLSRYFEEGEMTGPDIPTKDAEAARTAWREGAGNFVRAIMPVLTDPQIADLIVRSENGKPSEQVSLWWLPGHCDGRIILVRNSDSFSLNTQVTEDLRIIPKYVSDATIADFRTVVKELFPDSKGNWEYKTTIHPEWNLNTRLTADKPMEPSDVLLNEQRFHIFSRDVRKHLVEARRRVPYVGLGIYDPEDLQRITRIAEACADGTSLIQRAVNPPAAK